MVHSLTGFGRSEVSDDYHHYDIEVRSVNSRFLEITTRLPRSLATYENDLRQVIRKRVARGKVLLHVSEPRDTVRNNRFGFDLETVRSLVQRLREVGEETNITDNLGLSDLVTIADWLTPEDDDSQGANRLALAVSGLGSALDEFVRMNEEEGANLAADLRKRADRVAEVVEKINGQAGENRQAILERLRERIDNYLTMETLDQGRLEQEAAHIVDRMDITEEVVRMRSHIQLFLNALETGGTIGKRLNFVLQEMNREVNTMGSKAAAPEISSWVVEAKEELEKMREQVQNVA